MPATRATLSATATNPSPASPRDFSHNTLSEPSLAHFQKPTPNNSIPTPISTTPDDIAYHLGYRDNTVKMPVRTARSCIYA